EQEPEPEPEPDWEHGGGYRPSYDPEPQDEREEWSGLDPDPQKEWSHAGGYVSEAGKAAKARGDDHLEWAGDAAKGAGKGIKAFLERYPPEKYGGYYIGVLFLFLFYCSS
ncbi:MAG: hypothetical protein AAGK17_07370, partial [Pseudomonadota bacterium]